MVGALRPLLSLVKDAHARAAALAAAPAVLPRLVQLLDGAAGGVAQQMALHWLGHLAPASAPAAAGVAPALATVLSTPSVPADLRQRAAFLAKLLADRGQAAALLAAGVDRALQPLTAGPAPAGDDCCPQQQPPNSTQLSWGWRRRRGTGRHGRQRLPSISLDSRRQRCSGGRGQHSCSGSTAAAAAPSEPAGAKPKRLRGCASGCGATSGLRRCGACGSVRHCSEACSRAHWKAHRADCRRLQAERVFAAASAAAAPEASQP